ncbi:polysaccharide deacetylase family protein [Celerinatantimonas sp. MCCC 1A17872]|uniref:polysaccharide deacetylase family protein n=1 Tax=Celerinatantimonas sp. MCCC 1A17872 TaxID=3177514 RepID=UPI0038C8C64A
MTTNSYQWPKGKRCAVMLSIIYDDGRDALAIAPDLAQRSKSRSVWEYGTTRGVERLCEQLFARDLPTTWFVPAAVASERASFIAELSAKGHEIAGRGINFEQYCEQSDAQNIDCLKRTRETLATITGQAPKGFRLPSGLWPNGFDSLLKAQGFEWSSTLNGDDFPYQHQSGLIELPVQVELEDRPYFQFNFTPAFPKGHSRMAGYDAVLDNWRSEFAAYHEYGLCFNLQLRPEIIATPGRSFIVDELLDYIAQFDDVWFATGSQLAAWHQQSNQQNEAEHPVAVFAEYLQEFADGRQ